MEVLILLHTPQLYRTTHTRTFGARCTHTPLLLILDSAKPAFLVLLDIPGSYPCAQFPHVHARSASPPRYHFVAAFFFWMLTWFGLLTFLLTRSHLWVTYAVYFCLWVRTWYATLFWITPLPHTGLPSASSSWLPLRYFTYVTGLHTRAHISHASPSGFSYLLRLLYLGSAFFIAHRHFLLHYYSSAITYIRGWITWVAPTLPLYTTHPPSTSTFLVEGGTTFR